MEAGAEGEGWAWRTPGPAGLATGPARGASGPPLPRPGAPPALEAHMGPRPHPHAQVNRSKGGA